MTGSLVKGAVPPMPADAFVVEVVTDGESEVEEVVLAWCVSAQAADASEGDPIELETGEGGEGGEGDEKGEGLHAEVFTSHFEGLYGLTPMCSEGELDRILQEQLARLRSSWSNASSWHCSR